ncbi:alpha-(1,3)-fucosyltransferase 10-like [Pectinophora gossypiella]|uniref:alpha-(1,3)-fucosyltransferase 10-like n=1 Tax=Pectinophora gossypiella TaxID=13191 RepID=UPI00214E4E10|nr:alpha-(1,3)-fucosyltransferase 10-like [Pectinophora gossypiella]
MRFLAQYKFIIAIENAVCNDYITEKFWRAIEAGTVPIYFGSPLIRDWLPNNKSAILLEDFPTPELLSQHLHYLLLNDTAYEEYLEHKTSGLITNQNLINEVAARPYQFNIEDVIHSVRSIADNPDAYMFYGATLDRVPLPRDPGTIWGLFHDETPYTTIENAVCNDYVTEKFWRAIDVGTVPIYFGSPLIRDWLPNNKSAILLEDFPTPELLSQHLHYLLQNDTAYEEHLEHKTLGLISNQNLIKEVAARSYQFNIEDVINRFECFVCEKLHDSDSKTAHMI